MSTFKPSAAAILAGVFLAGTLLACTQPQIREERYPDGGLKTSASFLPASAGDPGALSDTLDATPRNPVKHGLQTSWYPDGGRRSLETYVGGYLQGYAFRWYPDGKLESVIHYTDGIRDGQSKFWDAAGKVLACSTPEGTDCDPALAHNAADPAATQRLERLARAP